MTPYDRLIESCPDHGTVSRDSQVQLVQALMARTRICPTDLTELDSTGYCAMCGRQEATAPRSPSEPGRGQS